MTSEGMKEVIEGDLEDRCHVNLAQDSHVIWSAAHWQGLFKRIHIKKTGGLKEAGKIL